MMLATERKFKITAFCAAQDLLRLSSLLMSLKIMMILLTDGHLYFIWIRSVVMFSRYKSITV